MKLFIFGSTGDLVKRKVMKALQFLNLSNLEIFAMGRRDFNDEEYLKFIGQNFPSEFTKRIKYVKVNFGNPKAEDLEKYLNKKEVNFFYISLPPDMQKEVLELISRLEENFKTETLMEKPFGRDLKGSIKLKRFIENSNLKGKVSISDHYIFKKGFEKISIQNPKIIKIKAHETIGIEGRGNYYDSVGALRDMIQSHFLNLVLKNLNIRINPKDISVKNLLRGQYRGYREELGNESRTDTFVMVEFEAMGIDFEFSTGKSMDKKETSVEINGKKFFAGEENSYEEVFRRFLSKNLKDFPTPDDSILGWEIIETIEKKKPKLLFYGKGSDLEEIKNLQKNL